jgi:hypothetical protein
VLGTWAFMAPEQRHSARHVDRRTDLYALGATLYALLTAEQPFDLFAADQDARLLAGLPPCLAEIIRRSTRYNPADRYDDALEMVEELVQSLNELDPIPEGTPELGADASIQVEQGADTAAFDQADELGHTDGPAADLLFGARHTSGFSREELDGHHELALHWKLLVTIAPALIAAAAGGAVMMWHQNRAEPTPDISRVSIEGDVVNVELIDAQGQSWPPGQLAPGPYQIEARFELHSPLAHAGDLDLPAHTELSVRCDQETRRCEPVEKD